jgi:hypothetical protein
MVEPRVLLDPKGFNDTRPKINIGSNIGSVLVGGQSIICSIRLYIGPNCRYMVKRDV